MFLLGLIFGLLLAALVVGCLVMRASRSIPLTSYSSRQAIWDIERRTIHNLLTAEFVTQDIDTTQLGDILQDRLP